MMKETKEQLQSSLMTKDLGQSVLCELDLKDAVQLSV